MIINIFPTCLLSTCYLLYYSTIKDRQCQVFLKNLDNKTIPWSVSTEDIKTIYNKWEEIVFPNGVSRIKKLDVMSAAKTIKELRKQAGYNREEVAGLGVLKFLNDK